MILKSKILDEKTCFLFVFLNYAQKFKDST
jgi:hypothetical protein